MTRATMYRAMAAATGGAPMFRAVGDWMLAKALTILTALDETNAKPDLTGRCPDVSPGDRYDWECEGPHTGPWDHDEPYSGERDRDADY